MAEELQEPQEAPVSLAAEFAVEDAPKARAKKAKEPVAEAPATTKYMVIRGAIAPFGGGRSDLVQPGQVVALTADQAKHYNKLGFLKPYIED